MIKINKTDVKYQTLIFLWTVNNLKDSSIPEFSSGSLDHQPDTSQWSPRSPVTSAHLKDSSTQLDKDLAWFHV